MPPETLGINFDAIHLPVLPETTPQIAVRPCLSMSGVGTSYLLSACLLLSCHMPHLSSGSSHSVAAKHTHAPSVEVIYRLEIISSGSKLRAFTAGTA